MVRVFPALTATLAVIACGTVHGLWTDRWQRSAEPAASVARLSRVRLSLEDWASEDLSAEAAQVRGVAGHLFYRCTNRRTGKKVALFMVCDRPGPVSIHTPDVCYGAVGFEVMTPARFVPKLDEGAAAASFWSAKFRKKTAADSTELRIYWGWNAGNGWEAAKDPRLAYARYPALYKLYLIHELAAAETSADDPCPELMKQLLPELQRALFPPP